MLHALVEVELHAQPVHSPARRMRYSQPHDTERKDVHQREPKPEPKTGTAFEPTLLTQATRSFATPTRHVRQRGEPRGATLRPIHRSQHAARPLCIR